MTALVLQARIDSSRLAGKSMLPLGGRPIVFRVMEAFAFFPCEEKILACPKDSESAFAPLAEEAGFTIITGPKDDVLARYCLVARRLEAKRVIRATADNPFVFSDAALDLNRQAVELSADYAGHFGLPYGAGVESINCDALFRAEREAAKAEKEHVCPYLYNHPELFKLHRPLAPLSWQGPNFRVTIDTQEDYDRAQLLYENLLSLPLERRNLGENVIAAYKNLLAEKGALEKSF